MSFTKMGKFLVYTTSSASTYVIRTPTRARRMSCTTMLVNMETEVADPRAPVASNRSEKMNSGALPWPACAV